MGAAREGGSGSERDPAAWTEFQEAVPLPSLAPGGKSQPRRLLRLPCTAGDKHLGVLWPLPTQTQGSPVYRYCSRAPKATGLICGQRLRSEAVTQHKPPADPDPKPWTHQGVPKDHNTLALPLGVQHVGEVGTASTQDAAVSPERPPMHHEDHVTVDALLQKPGEQSRGAQQYAPPSCPPAGCPRSIGHTHCRPTRQGCLLTGAGSCSSDPASCRTSPACTHARPGEWHHSALHRGSAHHQRCWPHSGLLGKAWLSHQQGHGAAPCSWRGARGKSHPTHTHTPARAQARPDHMRQRARWPALFSTDRL